MSKVNNFQKGYFTAIILVILILTLLGILAQQTINYNLENETIDQLIITKHLTEERSLFEYNLKNTLQSFLDYKVKKTQDLNSIQSSIDIIFSEFLFANNFPNGKGYLLLEVKPKDGNIYVYYKYTILNQLKKTITYENKSIEIKIPDNYTVANTVVVG